MTIGPKPTPKRRTHPVLTLPIAPDGREIQPHARAMVTVDAVLDIAVLAVHAGVQARQVRNSLQLLLGRLVLVLEDAFVALGARAAEVVVIAEFCVSSAPLRALQDDGGDGERGVQAAVAGDPVVEFGVGRDDVEGRGGAGARGAVLERHGEDHGRGRGKGDAGDARPGVWRGRALAAPVAEGLHLRRGEPVRQLLELAIGGLALDELVVAEDMVKV